MWSRASLPSKTLAVASYRRRLVAPQSCRGAVRGLGKRQNTRFCRSNECQRTGTGGPARIVFLGSKSTNRLSGSTRKKRDGPEGCFIFMTLERREVPDENAVADNSKGFVVVEPGVGGFRFLAGTHIICR